MPDRPQRPCARPGCPALTAGNWCPAHQPKPTLEFSRESASRRGYGRRWQRLRLVVLANEPLCELCGQLATDVDHRVSRARGGLDTFENLRPLCHSCHAKKTVAEDRGLGRRPKRD